MNIGDISRLQVISLIALLLCKLTGIFTAVSIVSGIYLPAAKNFSSWLLGLTVLLWFVSIACIVAQAVKETSPPDIDKLLSNKETRRLIEERLAVNATPNK